MASACPGLGPQPRHHRPEKLMKRLLLLSLLVLPRGAQYTTSMTASGSSKASTANTYDDYLQNRSWLRARVTIPAGKPVVIVSQHCPCLSMGTPRRHPRSMKSRVVDPCGGRRVPPRPLRRKRQMERVLRGCLGQGHNGGQRASGRVVSPHESAHLPRSGVPSRNSSVPRFTITSPSASAPCTSTSSPLATPRFTFT